MKKLLLIVLILLSFSVSAALFVSENDIATKTFKAYGSKSICPGECFEMPTDFDVNYFYVKSTVDENLIETKELAIDESLKASHLSTLAAKSLSDSYLAKAISAIEEGKKVIALLAVRNVPKNLTTAQIAQINSIYAEIKTLLETGSLVTAKEKISEVTPDGVLVTEADKTALINELNSYLGL